ncbi:hypothetical protein E3N88_45724 [Mikania micrantha]|uniref:Uncharacterized protein n=1 Tax=Mikania micrantha TaxID=192012 RepID=A0A5N6L8X6_9ASTR|nr:hypothetical protein E3N88_45724 [Mikania micrantha]
MTLAGRNQTFLLCLLTQQSVFDCTLTEEQESDLMTALEEDDPKSEMMQEWVITVVMIKRCCILKRDVDQSDAWVIVFLCEVQPRRVGYKSVSGHRNLGVPSPSFAEFVTEDEG